MEKKEEKRGRKLYSDVVLKEEENSAVAQFLKRGIEENNIERFISYNDL